MTVVITEAVHSKTLLSAWDISDRIALFAFVLSVISVLISFWALILQKKLNTINLQAVFFEKIFQDYFIEKIPSAAKKLSFDNNGKLKSSYREINRTLMEMMEQCMYFYFAKREFYDELKQRCQQLEDKLIETSNEFIENRSKQSEFIHSVEEDISDIVKCINDNYSNK